MTVKVELLDGSFIAPSYDPEHASGILDFYIAKLIAGEILSYEIVS
jgi:Na+/citrate or Na+/malate symporter